MTDDFAGLPSYDVLASPVPEPGRKPATWWVVGGVVALVAALIGGITYGAASLSGGGEQPEGALPAGAIAFAKVDLEYRPQNPNGTLEPGIHFKFDIKANKDG